MGANAKNKLSKKQELAPVISKFLFYEGDDSSKSEHNEYIVLKVEIRELLREQKNRQILAEVLLELQKDVSGETLIRLQLLYKSLGLHEDAYKKLKSWRWEVVSKGILELTRMRVEEAYGFITPFINHKRSVVRKQAEIAVVSLRQEGIKHFLDSSRYSVSEWQQLKLLEVIRNFKNFDPPRFRQWLVSSNPDVVLFSLRLIKYYDQNDAVNAILPLIKHKNNEVKIAALECIRQFGYEEALAHLKNIFFQCVPDVKLLILDTIANLGSESDIPFLKSIESKDRNFTIISKSLSAINSISPDTVLPTEGLDETLIDVPDSDEKLVETPINDTDEEFILDVTLDAEHIEERNEIVEEVIAVDTEEMTHIMTQTQELAESLPKPQHNAMSFIVHTDEIDEDLDTQEAVLTENLGTTIYPPTITEVDEADNSEIEEIELTPGELVEATLLKNLHYVPTESIFKTLFVNKENFEKKLLLTTIEFAGDAREIPLLKEIIANEMDKEIKTLAEDVLQTLIGNDETLQEMASRTDENEVFQMLSVFEKLFEEGDKDSKLMLLDQIAILGDHKELLFLNKLIKHKDVQIRKKVITIKCELEAKLGIVKTEECSAHEDVACTSNTSKMVLNAAVTVRNKQRIAMEYAFLSEDLIAEELEEDIPSELTFQLAEKSFAIEDAAEVDKIIAAHRSFTAELEGLLGQLNALPKILKDKFNG